MGDFIEREKTEAEKRPLKAKKASQEDGHFIFCKIVGGKWANFKKGKNYVSIFISKAGQN